MSPNPILRAFGLAAALGATSVAPAALAQAVADPAPSTVAPAVLTPEAEAFRATLGIALGDRPAAERQAIDGFYAARGYTPFWTAEDAAAGQALLAALEASPQHGLPAGRYGAADVAGALDPADGADTPAAHEAAMTRAYLAFAGDLSAGVLTPSAIDEEINIEAVRPDRAALLAPLDSQPVADALRALEPQAAEYRGLLAEKSRLEALIGTEPWGPPVPSGPTLHRGESHPRVADLRARLARLGYPSAPSEQPEMAFDGGLQTALEQFQRDHGLVDDGVAGRRTLDAVNAGVEDRLEQVLVNLERMRWMNHDLGARYITVNIPDYSVTMVANGAPVYETRAVVGVASETETPEFSDVMTHMVVNPTWHIPDSIATRVYLPKLKRDPSVLARSNMSLFTRSGVQINPRLVNFEQYSAGSFPFRVKQNPSAANALGRVKFMFPNQFSIYLHDTPARELFAKDARAFSNGCVRLEKPLELAYTLLEDQVADPEAAFDGWLAAKSERYVNLDTPVPVHILYRTAWAEPDGTVRYRDDVYGRDAKVFGALKAAGVRLPAAQG